MAVIPRTSSSMQISSDSGCSSTRKAISQVGISSCQEPESICQRRRQVNYTSRAITKLNFMSNLLLFCAMHLLTVPFISCSRSLRRLRLWIKLISLEHLVMLEEKIHSWLNPSLQSRNHLIQTRERPASGEENGQVQLRHVPGGKREQKSKMAWPGWPPPRASTPLRQKQ